MIGHAFELVDGFDTWQDAAYCGSRIGTDLDGLALPTMGDSAPWQSSDLPQGEPPKRRALTPDQAAPLRGWAA